MARKRKNREGEEGAETEGVEASTQETETPVVHCEVTEENPSGIESVSEAHAEKIGQLRGFGGPGADGATVAGPLAHVATEGGEKPLPLPASQEVEVEEQPEQEDQPVMEPHPNT